VNTQSVPAKDAAQILEEIAKYLEFKNENPFKVRAFANGARILKGKSTPLNELIASGELQQTKGIGKGLLEKLQELIENGRSLYLEELRDGTPEGLREMLRVPGLGPKKVRILFDQLKIKNLEQLEEACKTDKLNSLKGFGEKTAKNILKGIEFLHKYSARNLFGDVYPHAKSIERFLNTLKEAQKVSLAGSLRRHGETPKDIDMVVATQKPEKIMDAFTKMENVESITSKGKTKSAVVLKGGIRADLRTVTPKEFPYALHHFTGSKAHNTAMRSRAKTLGLKMNEYGLFKGEKLIPC
jgi:DNA polymerase (family 10)